MTAWRCRELADVVDLNARRALAEFAVPGESRPLVIASGTGRPAPGQAAAERDGHGSAPAHMGAGMQTRRDTAELTLALAGRGVRSSVLRLPRRHRSA